MAFMYARSDTPVVQMMAATIYTDDERAKWLARYLQIEMRIIFDSPTHPNSNKLIVQDHPRKEVNEIDGGCEQGHRNGGVELSNTVDE